MGKVILYTKSDEQYDAFEDFKSMKLDDIKSINQFVSQEKKVNVKFEKIEEESYFLKSILKNREDG